MTTCWHELVGGGDAAHLRYGCDVRSLWGEPGRLMSYLVGYLTRSVGDDREWGRRWGRIGKMPQEFDWSVEFKRAEWVVFLRRVRRWGRHRGLFQHLSCRSYGARVFGPGRALEGLLRGLDGERWFPDIEGECPF